MRAAMVMIQGNRHVQGASTITQQVAKNFLLTNERSFDRKIKEALLSFRIESAYSKEKDPRTLSERDLSRSRQLRRRRRRAELLRQVRARADRGGSGVSRGAAEGPPNNYHPFLHKDKAIDRRNYVIDQMVKNGYVSVADGDKAKAQPLGVTPRVLSPNTYSAGFFAEEVRRELNDKYGEKKLYEGGLSVRTHARSEDAADGAQGAGRRSSSATTRRMASAGRCATSRPPATGVRRWPKCRRSATSSRGSSLSCST